MNPEARKLFDKAVRMIESAEPRHRNAVERWLSLMNVRINQMPFSFALFGASQGVCATFEAKFGKFTPRITL